MYTYILSVVVFFYIYINIIITNIIIIIKYYDLFCFKYDLCNCVVFPFYSVVFFLF